RRESFTLKCMCQSEWFIGGNSNSNLFLRAWKSAASAENGISARQFGGSSTRFVTLGSKRRSGFLSWPSSTKIGMWSELGLVAMKAVVRQSNSAIFIDMRQTRASD